MSSWLHLPAHHGPDLPPRTPLLRLLHTTPWTSHSHLRLNMSKGVFVILLSPNPDLSQLMDGPNLLEHLGQKPDTWGSPLTHLFLLPTPKPSGSPLALLTQIQNQRTTHWPLYLPSSCSHCLLPGFLQQPPTWSFCSTCPLWSVLPQQPNDPATSQDPPLAKLPHPTISFMGKASILTTVI